MWKKEKDYRAGTEERIFEAVMREATVTHKGYTRTKPSVPIDSFDDVDMSDDDSIVPQRRSARHDVTLEVVYMSDEEDSSFGPRSTRAQSAKRQRINYRG